VTATGDDLTDLLAISRYAGADLLLVQGGGGNTSVKSADGARMWIKASGLRLEAMRADHGYVEADLPALRLLLADEGLRSLPADEAHEAGVRGVAAALRAGGGPRASLETPFHAALDRLVLHTHPVYVNAFTCMVGGAAALAESVVETAIGGPILRLPYATPGFALGAVVADGLATAGASGLRPAVVVLANHGLIVHGGDAPVLVHRTERMTTLGETHFGPLSEGALEVAVAEPGLARWAEEWRRVLVATGVVAAEAVVRPARFSLLHAAVGMADRWLTLGPLMPDDVVYAGRRVFFAAAGGGPTEFVSEVAESTDLAGRLAVAVEGLGLVLAGPSEGFVAAMEENLLAHVLVRQLIARAGGEAQALPSAAVEALCAMESETYRRAVASGPPRRV
jgi:rhamnose utilization protein RhaD (predicted bifunctional aldolase and dehydrogenase)